MLVLKDVPGSECQLEKVGEAFSSSCDYKSSACTTAECSLSTLDTRLISIESSMATLQALNLAHHHACAPGKHFEIATQTCETCPAGYMCRLGAITGQCPLGQFYAAAGAHKCETATPACVNSANQWETVAATTSSDRQCITCASGTYFDTATKACLQCEAGHKCSGGVKSTCGANNMYSSAGANVCLTCSAGSVTSGGDVNTRTRCCASTSYVVSGSCTACPTGYTCDGVEAVPCTGNQIGAREAVHADLTGSITFGTSWHTLTNWRTSGDSANALFDDSAGAWSNSNGRFTAAKAGYYRASTNIRVDGHDSSYMRVLIAKNGNTDYNNGLHSIEGNGKSTNYHSVTVDGLLKLAVGDYVTVMVYSNGDSSWTAQHESGFSINYLGSSVTAVQADMYTTQSIASTGYHEVTGWRTSGDSASTLFDNSAGAWSNSNGRFTAKATGYYRVATNIRVDSHSTSYLRVLIAKNGNTDVHNGLHSIKGNGESTDYTHMRAGGLVQLNAGEYV
eukprot:g8128.t1